MAKLNQTATKPKLSSPTPRCDAESCEAQDLNKTAQVVPLFIARAIEKEIPRWVCIAHEGYPPAEDESRWSGGVLVANALGHMWIDYLFHSTEGPMWLNHRITTAYPATHWQPLPPRPAT